MKVYELSSMIASMRYGDISNVYIIDRTGARSRIAEVFVVSNNSKGVNATEFKPGLYIMVEGEVYDDAYDSDEEDEENK